LDDVIVVGAGPAGNNAALGLASRGYSVTVIDARQRIGEKLCTGIVGRECTDRFPIDPALIYREAFSADVVAPSIGHVRFETATPRRTLSTGRPTSPPLPTGPRRREPSTSSATASSGPYPNRMA